MFKKEEPHPNSENITVIDAFHEVNLDNIGAASINIKPPPMKVEYVHPEGNVFSASRV